MTKKKSSICKHGVIGPCQACGTRKGAGKHETKMVTIGGKTIPTCAKCGYVEPYGGFKSTCKGTVGLSLWR